MEQFGQIGEVLGSLKALMVFKDNIQINQRQCCLLVDIFSFAYDSIAEEMRQNLRFEERQLKWKVLEHPLKELRRIFREAEIYIKQCLEIKDWWAKAIILYQNTDCIEFYIHNLLGCIPIVIEAIELAGEISGWDHDEMQKKRFLLSNKYRKEWEDPKLFQWKFAKQYLITPDFCTRIDTVWKEDRWILLCKIQEKKISGNTTKQGRQLLDLLLKSIDGSEPGKLLPCKILVKSRDYQVRRRLGGGSQYKEILWLGESFALRHFFGDIAALAPEISSLLSLSHPNISHFLCGFTDEEKKECYLVKELMTRDIQSYIREICGPRRRIPFSLPVAVDLMLQIARGMEYLHSKKIFHGDLNPSNILVKSRGSSSDGYLHCKVSGFGLTSVKKFTTKSSSTQNGPLPFIWYAPEVLEEQEQTGSTGNLKYTEKSDVYSFSMVSFELLTGKYPFEDAHLQGDKMSRNIRAGERPLFPFHSPKYVTNLTRRCWQAEPSQRPTFSSICRILRYIKRFLVMNPDYNSQQFPPMPLVDYFELEMRLLSSKFPSWETHNPLPITEIPFQMFAYKVEEKDKAFATPRDTSESGSDKASISGDENVITIEEPFPHLTERKFLPLPEAMNKKLPLSRRYSEVRGNKPETSKKDRLARPPQLTPRARPLRMNSESQLMVRSLTLPRLRSGHMSDSELS